MSKSEEHLFPLLLKHLPQKVYCSNNKSGAHSKAPALSHIALKHYSFIQYNSDERISAIIFDKDLHENKTALEYYKDIPTFFEWLIEKNIPIPSWICETSKGFQFGYIIKGFMRIQKGFSPKNSPEQFLNDIKQKYIKYLELDRIASSKSKAVFRNPLKHKYISYPSKIYNLNDLNEPFKNIKFEEDLSSYKTSYTPISKYRKINDHRNCSIFKLCCNEFAYSKPTKKQIFNFANNLNQNNCNEALVINEVKSITNSIYKRCQEGTLKSGSRKAKLNREKLVKDRKKQIIKYFLKCKQENTKPNKSEIARSMNISYQALNKTYGDFIKIRYKI